jgi:hypothetical protein
MRDIGFINTDQIGKVFVVRCQGLLECLVCGEVFTRSTAPAHPDVDCYPAVELCLLEPQGGEDVT